MKWFSCLAALLLTSALSAQITPATIRYYLSGTDKDHTVAWDFFCTKGRKSGSWTKIAVPSNWEQQGFGGYNYGHDKIKWDEEGLYRYSFPTLPAWKAKRVFIIFEGAMTDAEVKINGRLAGDKHQGGFYRFKYEITSLLRPDSANLLEVKVSKMSSDASVNHAERQGDFWVFGGIYRPVYLEIVPSSFIDRIAVNAAANGALQADVYKEGQAASVRAWVKERNGRIEGPVLSARSSGNKEMVSLKGTIGNIKDWNPEYPFLYDLVVQLLDERGRVLHQIKQPFGFRTVEVRLHDGIYLNGQRVLLKGVDHHCEWPETGRTLSPSINRMDVALIKEMNMNAVRMSHYPPDQDFLDCCDSLGLLVLDELTGWQAHYDTEVGRKLVKELVVRDVNHPCVIFWDNGNEGGFNRDLDSDFALYDPQHRRVLHPWERFNGIDTKHYPTYNYVVNSVLYDHDIFMPTEFMHGLYDGGGGAGLEDFWSLMLQHPACGGGFIWVFHDEAIARTDKDGWLDTDGNHAPDGLLGPHREKEGSFYTVKAVWSPVQIHPDRLHADFDGRLTVENHYFFTNLHSCTFQWKLMDWDQQLRAAGTCRKIDLAPGKTGDLLLDLPAGWAANDVLYLEAIDPHGKEIFTWSWAISSPQQVAEKRISRSAAPALLSLQDTENVLTIRSGDIAWSFDKKTGYLLGVRNGHGSFPLHDGPLPTGMTNRLRQFKYYKAGRDYIVEPLYQPDSFAVKWTFSPDMPAKLEYRYLQKKDADYMGITFDYPEDSIRGMTWVGNGPYRVWKNRLKGGSLGRWHKSYNNTVTGESWDYPEFKGYHSQLYWVRIEQKGQPFTIYTENEGLFLQLLKPDPPKGAGNRNTSPAFPDGDLGFMTSIPPIGTKFKPAADMGPRSQQNRMLNYTPFAGTLWFDFR